MRGTPLMWALVPLFCRGLGCQFLMAPRHEGNLMLLCPGERVKFKSTTVFFFVCIFRPSFVCLVSASSLQ